MIVRHLTSPETRLWLETLWGQASLAFVQGWTVAALEHTGAVRAAAVQAMVERTPQVPASAAQVVACLERLVELGELAEVGGDGEASPSPLDADRVFVAAPRRRYAEPDEAEVTETDASLDCREPAEIDRMSEWDQPASVGGCTSPERDCERDSDCPEHGRDRPGQCISIHLWDSSKVEGGS